MASSRPDDQSRSETRRIRGIPVFPPRADAVEILEDLNASMRRRLQVLAAVLVLLAVSYLLLDVLVSPRVRPLAGAGLVPEGLVGWRDTAANLQLLVLTLLAGGLFLIARFSSLSTSALIRVSLFYEVLIGLVVATTTLLTYMEQVELGLSWSDRGPSYLAVWVLIFPMVVPARRVSILLASLLTVSMEPALFLAYQAFRPELTIDLGGTLWVFKDSYVFALVAMLPAHVVSVLGRALAKERELGRYRLTERLGGGGMGEVWKAEHRHLARPAAIKIIRPENLDGDAAHVQTCLARFEREARATAQLHSPHSVSVRDYGLAEDGTFYLVTELLEGFDLATLVERFGPLPSERVVYLLGQICHSLHDAHVQGLVHRDVKPANVFTCHMGIELDFVKVLDFGLVAPLPPEDAEQTRLTKGDTATGTPAFMAPEQASNGPVDERTDVYGIGCVAYWLLTGQFVFEGNAVELLVQHMRDEPVPPSHRTENPVDPELESIVLQCLAKDPDERPADARVLGQMLAATGLASRWTERRCRAWWESVSPDTIASEGFESPAGHSREAEDDVPAREEPGFFGRRRRE